MPTCHCSVPQAVIAAFNTLAEGSELRLVIFGRVTEGSSGSRCHSLSYDSSVDYKNSKNTIESIKEVCIRYINIQWMF